LYLKSVEMQGFKSFADKIYLDFNPGITAIVGPNGSGKSNISDAIRWVMGEQSIKTLRGSKMEDVIFSGTQERKALGFAEVSLTLDNSTGIFPIDYDEITVSRRVYRSGESEYMMNKTPCRLRDIHELFMDTGLGKEGYSIIGQGRIDEILSNKSEDRRQIFEEAAGITKYKYRKNEAEKKLADTTDNLTRVADIMSELEGQLEPLREQSEKAKKYLILRDELKGLDINISVIEIKKNRRELESIEENSKTLGFDVDIIQNNISASENKINNMYDEIKNTEELIEQLREKEKKTVSDINDYTNRINILTANIEHENENILRIKSDIEKSKSSSKYLDSLLLDYQKRIMELETDKNVTDELLQVKQSEVSLMKQKEIEDKELFEKLNAEVINKKNENITYNEKIAAAKSLIENFEFRKNSLSEELNNQSEKIEQYRANLEKLQKEKENKEKYLSDLNNRQSKTEQLYNNSQIKLKEISEKRYLIDKNISQCQSRKSVLEDMEKDFEGYGKSVKAVMNAYKNGEIKNAVLHGPLSSLIHTDEKYVTAVEVALQNANQNIVTDTEEDAKAAIEFLKRTKTGRATFLPISAVRPRKFEKEKFSGIEGFVAIASELVSSDKKYTDVVNSILGATVVAENIDDAIQIAKFGDYKVTVVTLQGELIRPGGSLTGGSINKMSGFLSRAAEIKKLKSEILSFENELSEIIKEYEKTTQKTAEYLEENTLLIKELSAYNEEYIKLKADYDNYVNFVSSFENGGAQIEKELSEVISAIDNTKADILDFTEKLDINRVSINVSEQKISELEKDIEVLEIQIKEKHDELVEINIKLSSIIKDIEHQSERYDDVVTQRDNADNVNKERESEIEEHIRKSEEMKKQISIFEDEKERLAQNTEVNSEKTEELTEKKKSLSDKIRSMQEETKDTREQLFALKNQLSKLESKKNKTESDLDLLIDRLWEEYELTYSEAEKQADSIKEDFSIPKAQRRISELKNSIKNLGNINIDSIEGYKSVKERFDFLTAQTDDLKKSKLDLEKVIDELLSVMKKQFTEQFSVINKNFGIVFKELFGGGTARLELSDPENLLESGIEIEAQPPGKKLQRLTLLSGGERSFTAIALLFAILKVRPTPFCILDEIEAALDDVNVYRYADYLKKYSEKTQFIVVTHRRGTMEAANILYGVTMQERGVSKLLSLNIDEVTE